MKPKFGEIENPQISFRFGKWEVLGVWRGRCMSAEFSEHPSPDSEAEVFQLGDTIESIHTTAQTISIPAPKFDAFSSVTLHWNGEQHSTLIAERWFDLDKARWWYELWQMEGRFPESALEVHSQDQP